MTARKYRRILLKMSGEIFAGELGFGVDQKVVKNLASQVKSVVNTGLEVGIVIGGGNYLRGLTASQDGMHRVTGDYLGMLATIMNAVTLQTALENMDVDTRVLSAITITQLAEPYIRRRADRHLAKGRVVIFAAGTGNPYFTTDTAAVLRGIEIGADIIMKGTKVDGVYDADPMQNKDAKKFINLTFDEVLEKKLRVMDLTAITLCMDNDLPIIVFDIQTDGNMLLAAQGESIGTMVVRGENND